jgi:uncharacterized OB-fold protein
MISQFQETQSPLAHLRARANAARTPEDWRGIFAVALAVLDRQRDGIEELEVAIHNADMHRCGSCTALVPVSQEWCELCLRPETWVEGATRHEIDARENPRMVERGMR